ncbi:MAG: hypothetical protein KatS3mg105_0011 [Gemmatales bacterium]|nr:MAG: hypothetical protein KatS3mg105_0011 [Gemmatales bacterium]
MYPFRTHVWLVAVSVLPSGLSLFADPPPATQVAVATVNVIARSDRHGDPLPPGAVHRFGTTRLRHGSEITGLGVARDDRFIVSAGGHTIRLWNWNTGMPTASIHEDWVECVAVSADGKFLASGSGIGRLRLFDATTGRELRTFAGHSGKINSVAFSPDGRLLASASTDNRVSMWETATGKLLPLLARHEGAVVSVSFSPDQKFLVSAGADRMVRIWNIETGAEVRRVARPNDISCVAFSADGKVVISAEADNTVRFFDFDTGRQTIQLKHPAVVVDISLSRDGKKLAASTVRQTTHIWDVASGKPIQVLSAKKLGGNRAAFSADGKTLVTAGQGVLHIVDASKGNELQIHVGHNSGIRAAALKPDGSRLATADKDGTLYIWDTATEKLLKSLDTAARSIAWSSDGTCLVCLSDNIRLYRFEQSETETKLDIETDANPIAFAFAPDGRSFTVAYSDRSVRIWGIDGKLQHVLKGHNQPASAVAYSTDGRLLASAAANSVILLWDCKTGKLLKQIGECGDPACLAFSPNQDHLAAAGRDGLIALYDVANGKVLAYLEGHDQPVLSLAYSPNGKTLISGGQDGYVRLWETVSGREVLRFKGHTGSVNWVGFAPSGRTVYSGGDDTTVLAWDITQTSETAAAPIDLHGLWKELASLDGAPAYRAAWSFVKRPEESVPFMREHLQMYIGVDAGRIADLIDKLNDDNFMVRERASEELERLGQLASPALQQTLSKTRSLEVLRRIERILEKQKAPEITWPQQRLRVLRAIDVLEKIGTLEARQVLDRLAKGAPEVALMNEAKASLKRLSER